ncbi:uncharacterized protein SPSK_10378 [Sporothrix schenckii 1099-18]|uniref:Uncharacterized protein n=1 Tax=Sporothrix schenckii 1099-18 TaxID=1397361 RepID=A0A0F2LUU4_SPOSC|nr:uncharacterized protein SPSK_10378 [Sporothrix schenckii 1099-18]KJR81237.1 hypothetical protein SPSK_10378 [Sporothrix schenckii 1099-18]
MGVRGFKIDRGEESEIPYAEQNRQHNLFLALCDEVQDQETLIRLCHGVTAAGHMERGWAVYYLSIVSAPKEPALSLSILHDKPIDENMYNFAF